jgi:hypothetical protein
LGTNLSGLECLELDNTIFACENMTNGLVRTAISFFNACDFSSLKSLDLSKGVFSVENMTQDITTILDITFEDMITSRDIFCELHLPKDYNGDLGI